MNVYERPQRGTTGKGTGKATEILTEITTAVAGVKTSQTTETYKEKDKDKDKDKRIYLVGRADARYCGCVCIGVSSDARRAECHRLRTALYSSTMPTRQGTSRIDSSHHGREAFGNRAAQTRRSYALTA